MAQLCLILSTHLLLPGPSSLASPRAPPRPCFYLLPLSPLTQKPGPRRHSLPMQAQAAPILHAHPVKNTQLLFQPKGPKAFPRSPLALLHMPNQLLLPEELESKPTWSKQLLRQKAEILHCSQMLSHQNSCNPPASS